MGSAVSIVLVVIAVLIAVKLSATVVWGVGVIVGGLIVGALARWVLPGRQDMGWLQTVAYGLAGSLIGSAVAHLLGLHGIWSWALQIGTAAALVAGRDQLRLPRA